MKLEMGTEYTEVARPAIEILIFQQGNSPENLTLGDGI